MQAVLFPEARSLLIESVPDPTCRPDEVVLQVASCGICGTDLHIYQGEYIADFPMIPGHEFSGTIVEVGKEVTYLKVGERVTADPNIFCGYCDFCRNDQANHCLNWSGVGVKRNGAFAEYIAVPARNCYPVPDSLTDAQAAFIEPLACVAYALRRLRVWPADQVLIFGAGPMGLLLVQALQHSGASQVVAVEKQANRLTLAEQLGATTILADPAQAEALQTLAPSGFDVVIDATGVPAVIEGAFDYLKPRGQFLQFGVTPTDARVKINPYRFFKNDWTLIGSFAVCYSFQPAIAWLANNVIDITPLVSHTIPMADFTTAFNQFAQGQTLKVHIQVGNDQQ
jgi:2-desacetyl-2-hydroxyethyl bacteriochlorophyllide A dehydrogenase